MGEQHHGTELRGTTRAPTWTGRAAVARSTDSLLPEFLIAGTRRTRVSEMRLARRIDVRTRRATGHPTTRAESP